MNTSAPRPGLAIAALLRWLSMSFAGILGLRWLLGREEAAAARMVHEYIVDTLQQLDSLLQRLAAGEVEEPLPPRAARSASPRTRSHARTPSQAAPRGVRADAPCEPLESPTPPSWLARPSRLAPPDLARVASWRPFSSEFVNPRPRRITGRLLEAWETRALIVAK